MEFTIIYEGGPLDGHVQRRSWPHDEHPGQVSNAITDPHKDDFYLAVRYREVGVDAEGRRRYSFVETHRQPSRPVVTHGE